MSGVGELKAWARGYSVAVDETIAAFSRELMHQQGEADKATAPAIRTAFTEAAAAEALRGEILVALRGQVDALMRLKRESTGRQAWFAGKIEALQEAIGTVHDVATYVRSLSGESIAEMLDGHKAKGVAP